VGGPLLDYNDAKRVLEPPAERALANDATTAPGIDRKRSSVSSFRQITTSLERVGCVNSVLRSLRQWYGIARSPVLTRRVVRPRSSQRSEFLFCSLC
jgi:hypothetical protein